MILYILDVLALFEEDVWQAPERPLKVAGHMTLIGEAHVYGNLRARYLVSHQRCACFSTRRLITY